MAFSLFSRKKRKKKGRAPSVKAKPRLRGAPENHASAGVSPRRHAPARRSAATARKRNRRKPGAKRTAVLATRRWSGRALAGMALRAGIALFILGGVALMGFAATLPDIRDLNSIKKQQGITIETEDGRVVATYGDVYGAYIPYDRLPKTLIQAVIATEDRRFFKHHGVDFLGILRAAVVNLTHGRVVQGGSTVTQQVAKNVFLTPERSLTRKIQEVLLAFWLEGRYSKEEIMAIYLNRVYLGAGTFGVDAAARRYFNKSGTELNLVESAMIAGLLKAPSRYAPTASNTRAMARAHQVLKNMADYGAIRAAQIRPALTAFAKAPNRPAEGSSVRYYSDWVVDRLSEYIGNIEEDIIVVTTLDPKIQEIAADVVENTLANDGDAKRIGQAAVVLMAPDGAVRAMVGGKNYGESQYNRAAQAKRQPGSSFKVFVYLAALEAGYTPLAQVEDAPITLQVGNRSWSPDNYTNNYKGVVTMAQGFRESLNTVAVRLSQYAGVSRVAQMAMRLGLPKIPARPSIALGAVEATLLEMTGAYAHLANGGNRVEPYGVVEIHTAKGRELYKRLPSNANPVLAKGTVEMMNYMLLEVARRGTGTRAALPGRDVAGKTGTSQDYKDAWFIGFTPQLVGGVWLGNDNNRPMAKVTGGSIPAMIWHDVMLKALEGQPAAPIPASANSGEGLLPWLFGGEQSAAPVAPTPDGGAPVASPFGYVDAPPRNAPPAPARQSDDVLTDGFWNTLMDRVPNAGEVEYEYPGANPRR